MGEIDFMCTVYQYIAEVQCSKYDKHPMRLIHLLECIGVFSYSALYFYSWHFVYKVIIRVFCFNLQPKFGRSITKFLFQEREKFYTNNNELATMPKAYTLQSKTWMRYRQNLLTLYSIEVATITG